MVKPRVAFRTLAAAVEPRIRLLRRALQTSIADDTMWYPVARSVYIARPWSLGSALADVIKSSGTVDLTIPSLRCGICHQSCQTVSLRRLRVSTWPSRLIVAKEWSVWSRDKIADGAHGVYGPAFEKSGRVEAGHAEKRAVDLNGSPKRQIPSIHYAFSLEER